MVLTHNCTKLSKSRTNWAIVTWWLENCCCSLTSKIKAAGRPRQAQTKPDRSWSLTELVQNLWHPKSNNYVCYHENSKYWAVQSLGAWQPTNAVVHPHPDTAPHKESVFHSDCSLQSLHFYLEAVYFSSFLVTAGPAPDPSVLIGGSTISFLPWRKSAWSKGQKYKNNNKK